MTIYEPRWSRVMHPAAVILCVLMVGFESYRLARGDLGLMTWFQLIMYLCLGAVSIWQSYLALFVPIVRIGSKSLAWRYMVTGRFQEVSLSDLAGYRMQDSFDLRLRLNSGEERSIHLSQIPKRERPKLVSAIEGLVSKGAIAI